MRKKKIFYGWWIALISSILRFFEGSTYFYGFTAFFNPIRQTFGWGATETSVAFSLQRLETGAMAPISGFLTDRFGPKRMMLIGWGIVGAGFLAMSRTNSLLVFYVTFVVLALGISLAVYAPAMVLASRWFIRKRSRAITLSALGGGLGGLMIPLLTMSILQLGWRTSLVIAGLIIWAICLPLTLLIKDSPEQIGYLPDGDIPSPESRSTDKSSTSDDKVTLQGFSVKETLRIRTFWLICGVYFIQQLGTSAVFVHIMPYLESLDFPKMQAAYVVSGLAICSVAGRLSFGIMGDMFNKRYLLTISIVLQTAGLLFFSLVDVSRAWLLIIFLIIYGFGYGAPVVLRPAIQADYFGVKNFGTIMGLTSLASLVGGISSPVLAGWIFDTTGSYQLAWRIFTLVSAPAIPLMLMAQQPEN
ncbi:MFS transporter [Chloroflexota bacterium]